MLKQVTKLGCAALALAVLLSGVPAHAGDDTVVATVNGDKIVKGDVMKAMKNLKIKSEDTDKAFPVVVNQMINEKLINDEIAKSGIEKDTAFQQRLAAAKDQLIKTMFLEKYLKDKVSDDKVKDVYDKIKKDNKGKEEVHARHILVKTEDEAKAIIKQLDGGAKFADLAKSKSMGPAAKNGGDVGYFAKGEVLPEFADAAFALKPGSYTKTPVKTQFGWHVIYSEDKRARVIPEFKDVAPQLRAKVSQAAIEDMIRGLRAKAKVEQFTADGKPIEAPAAAPAKK